METGTHDQAVTKDCRVCNRRRIKCDRTVPSCRKCDIKGVECPGYGPRIRWTNAAAIRGRYKGLGTLATFGAARQSTTTTTPVDLQASEIDQSFNDRANHSSVELLTRSLPEHIVDRLLHHYSTSIAPLMVWLDSEHNPYKRLVVPLSETHAVLRLALLAISAAHIQHELKLEATFAHSAGQNAVIMITDRVRQFIEMSEDGRRAEILDGNREIEAILAAILTLSNHSLLKSEIFPAQSHRHAARVLINTLSLSRASDDELTIFLRNQLATYDILACTTLFSHRHVEHVTLPVQGQDVPFGRFLEIIQRITICSFQHLNDVQPTDTLSLLDLETEFELSHGLTLMAAGPLMTGSAKQPSPSDFVRVSQLYHHARMVYACGRLCITDKVTINQLEKEHSTKLFHALRHIENVDVCLQNFPWPILIAGTATHEDPERRKIVRSLCEKIFTDTRFEHYAILSTFLEELWQGSNQDWCLLARQWEERGQPIIAV
ncbi:uncharacterized protein PFLUO_LOCUS4157 [Penicillium psychrofluorescens]|uniref:uncharacterized protein n=1 Tax=Penicillium psychrofluorescens TaxID=3158075 RepID=UPI003CCD756E